MKIDELNIDQKIFKYSLKIIKEIFPLHRSISGEGIDAAFSLLESHLDINLHKFLTNDTILDWKVPPSWKCHDAFIKDI